MMLRITNISITDRAATLLAREMAAIELRPGEVFSLTYLSKAVGADDTTVAGFRPGYMAGPGSPDGAVALAHLPNRVEFYFLPKFKWNARERYVVDIVRGPFALFSIGPVT